MDTEIKKPTADEIAMHVVGHIQAANMISVRITKELPFDSKTCVQMAYSIADAMIREQERRKK